MAHLAADRACRVFAPMALESAGLGEAAAKLRALAPMLDVDSTKRALDSNAGLLPACGRAAGERPLVGGDVAQDADMALRAACLSALAADLADTEPQKAAEEAKSALSLAGSAGSSASLAATQAFIGHLQSAFGGGNVSGIGNAVGPSDEQVQQANRALLVDLVAVAHGKDLHELAPAPIPVGGAGTPAQAASAPPSASTDAGAPGSSGADVAGFDAGEHMKAHGKGGKP